MTIFHLKHSPINWMRFILGVQHYSCWVQHACPASLSRASLVWLSILKYNFLHATRFHINTDSKSLLLPCAQVEEPSSVNHTGSPAAVFLSVNVFTFTLDDQSISSACQCLAPGLSLCALYCLQVSLVALNEPHLLRPSRSSLVHQHTLCQLSLSRPGPLTHKSCAA